MRTRSLVAALLVAALAAAGCGHAGPSSGLVAIGAGLSGPAGTRATIYATGLPKVSAFALDAQGRLWAATAAYTSEGGDGVYLVAAAGATPSWRSGRWGRCGRWRSGARAGAP
jgi:hypothetical protein